MLRAADLVLDLERRAATRGGRALQLTDSQLRILEHLIRFQGQVVPRTVLAELLWGPDAQGRSNAINVQMSRLRQEVDPPGSAPLIHTRRGFGYVLELPPGSGS